MNTKSISRRASNRPATQPGAGVETTGLAILLWSVSIERPVLCATPFMHAAAAAALDLEVELHFSAESVRLLEDGVADRLFSDAGREQSLGRFMRDAHRHGARFLACASSLQACGLTRARLIPEVEALAGATSFINRVADPSWRTLVF